MTFAVTFKGIRLYCGKLPSACRYIEEQWGSYLAAAEIGVKLDPILGYGTR